MEYEGDRPVAVRTVVVSTQHAERHGRPAAGAVARSARPSSSRSSGRCSRSAGFGDGRHQVPHQPDRPVRHRRPARRRRAHRPQDHRGHLRRHGAARRRRVQRQGPVQGGPLRGLRGALGGQEHRRRGAGPALRGAGGLRHRRGASRSPSWWTPSAPASCPDERLERVVSEVFDLTPRGIITALKLQRPIYSPTAAYGHFGRKPAKGQGQRQAAGVLHLGSGPSRVRALLSEAR